jgi:hypothetical protein
LCHRILLNPKTESIAGGGGGLEAVPLVPEDVLPPRSPSKSSCGAGGFGAFELLFPLPPVISSKSADADACGADDAEEEDELRLGGWILNTF